MKVKSRAPVSCVAETLINGGRELRRDTEELATLRSCYYKKDKPVGPKKQREKMHTLGQWEPMWEELLTLGLACSPGRTQCCHTKGLGQKRETRNSQTPSSPHLPVSQCWPPTNPAHRSVTEKGGKWIWSEWTYGQVR